MKMSTRRRERREAREAELSRQDREAAERLTSLTSASEVALDGTCPGCGGRRFRPMETAGEAATRGFLAAGLIGSVVAVNQEFTECVTCGKIFPRAARQLKEKP